MKLATLLLLTTLTTIPPTTLILRNGNRIDIEGPIQQENGTVVFRQAGGALYSIPLTEIDMEATRAAAMPATVVRPDGEKKLKVSEEERKRLLADLAKNRSGKPATEEQMRLDVREERDDREKPERVSGTPKQSSEEWEWRNRARAYEENLRQAHENVETLTARAEQLRSQIAGFLSLGYKPHQFSYQTTQLAYVEEQLPYARLEVQRAQRAYEQFREDARKQGILPGWLR